MLLDHAPVRKDHSYERANALVVRKQSHRGHAAALESIHYEPFEGIETLSRFPFGMRFDVVEQKRALCLSLSKVTTQPLGGQSRGLHCPSARRSETQLVRLHEQRRSQDTRWHRHRALLA
jgi:hypothetical protein